MDQKFKIIYEDNMIIAVDKPAGLLSQGDKTGSENLLDLLKVYLKDKHKKTGNVFLGLVHRLDRNTSGVICFAKNSKSASRLSEQFRIGTAKRVYITLVSGNPKHENKTLEGLIDKDNATNTVKISKNGKKASLTYKVLERFDNAALLEVLIHTGRPHQIRIQLANEGLPVIGDYKYGKGSKLIKRPSVHAYSLGIIHPVTKSSITLRVDIPRDIRKAIDLLSK